MATITVDCKDIASKEALHALLKQQLSLPEYYGGNLDALHDCLTEMPETHLEITGIGSMKESLGFYADVFLLVLSDAAEENEKLTVSLFQ